MNVFKERQTGVGDGVKKAIFVVSGLLIVWATISHFLNSLEEASYVVSSFMLAMIVYAMLLIRRTKPVMQIKHRERIERLTAMVCLIVLPIAFVIDYLPERVPALSQLKLAPLNLTLPLLFIFITGGKLLDDIKRLALFRPKQEIHEQNLKNYNFTEREKEIVKLVIEGSSYKEISEKLFISMPTVKTHISNIYRKAEVNNKIGLINRLNG